MSGKDKNRFRNQTVTFRMSPVEKKQLEARLKISGLPKGQFFIRSVIDSKVVVVGKKEQIDRIIYEIQEMDTHVRELAGQLKKEELAVTSEDIKEIQEDYFIMLKSIMWVLEGSKRLLLET